MVKTLKKFFIVNLYFNLGEINQQKNPLIIGCVSTLGEFIRNKIIVLLWKVSISSSLQILEDLFDNTNK